MLVTTCLLRHRSGMMNGVPWIVAASVNKGVEFGLFVNTLGWTYGTASAVRQQFELYSTRAVAVDIVVATWPSASSPTGTTRADSIQGTLAFLRQYYTDAFGNRCITKELSASLQALFLAW